MEHLSCKFVVAQPYRPDEPTSDSTCIRYGTSRPKTQLKGPLSAQRVLRDGVPLHAARKLIKYISVEFKDRQVVETGL